jgi:glycosyltransferase involved in cell wall biosynthesis
VTSHIDFDTSTDERVVNDRKTIDFFSLTQVIAEQSKLIGDLSQQIGELHSQVAELDRQHRLSHSHIEFLTGFVRGLERAIDPLRLRSRLVPRLFRLHQYSPQKLILPARYSKATPPANAPQISIVTPSFNQAAFLPRTIESVLQQNYPQLEYIVQDGGSHDNSVEVLRRYAKRLTHWASRPDGGQSNAINLGFARSTGSIMGWLNSDDMLLPGALACIAEFFQRHPEIDVVYGSRVIVDAHDREIGRWLLPAHDDALLRWVDYVPQETLFWRRDIWERSGGYIDETFHFAMDWDLLLRFQDARAKFACIPRYLGAFRVTEGTKTSREINTIGQCEVERIRMRTLGYLPDACEIGARTRPYLRRHMWRRLLGRIGFVRN